MSTCPFCSEEIAADAAQCPSCDMELPGPSPANVGDAPPVQSPKSNAKKWILIGGAGCGLCLLVLVCLAALLLPVLGRARDAAQRQAAGGDGRDHNKNAFTLWMAGGGVKGGTIHGTTDELGLAAVEDRVSVPDWHATILHLLGLDHEQLVFLRNGLEERLTGVFEPRVVHEILA